MSKTGFTLIEILVSSILIALVLTGLANLFVIGKRLTLHAQYRMTGGELGKVFLSPLQMQVRQDTWGTSNLGTARNYTSSQTIDGITYNATYNITNITNPNLKRVRVSINWTETPP